MAVLIFLIVVDFLIVCVVMYFVLTEKRHELTPYSPPQTPAPEPNTESEADPPVAEVIVDEGPGEETQRSGLDTTSE